MTTTPAALTMKARLSTGTGREADVDLALTHSFGVFLGASPSQAIGYATGAGATVTQITSRATGVTVNAPCGYIQTDTTSLAAAAEATFTVTNNNVAVGDVVLVCIRSGAAATPLAWVSAVAAGSFDITISNLHASTGETGALLINFIVVKAVSA